jgi:telomere length regulation protein
MADFLKPVRQTYTKSNAPEEVLSLSKTSEVAQKPQGVFKGASPEEALETLKSQPGFDTLLTILTYLRRGSKHNGDFDIRRPTALNAQIIHALVTEIVPNYWAVLQESSDGRDINILLDCLRSLPGINAAITYLKSLIREAKSRPKDLKNSHVLFNLACTSSLLSNLLQGKGQLVNIWSHIASMNNQTQVRPLRNEFLTLFASGKIVSLAAEAEDICRQASHPVESLWIADNKQYLSWLAHSLVHWIKKRASEDDLKMCAELGARSIRLGNAGMAPCHLIKEVANLLHV